MQLPFQLELRMLNAICNYATIADAPTAISERIACRAGCGVIAMTP
jgi:hypothetical protein